MIQFTFTNKETENYKTWISFYPKRDKQTPFRIELEKWGYFDPRPQFNSSVTSLFAVVLPFFSLWFLPLSILFLFFGWGSIYLSLPYNTGKGNEAENPSYGLNTYTNGKIITEFWFYWDKKRKHVDLPWALQWFRTSTLLNDNSWFNEVKGKRLDWNSKEYGSYDWLEENKWKDSYPYVDSYDNSLVTATVSVVEREWRPRWFRWTNLFAKACKDIDIKFDKEVGRQKGSWKGGVLGCSWVIKKGETPLQALRRMEKERKF